jgi:hypothetical protein
MEAKRQITRYHKKNMSFVTRTERVKKSQQSWGYKLGPTLLQPANMYLSQASDKAQLGQ